MDLFALDYFTVSDYDFIDVAGGGKCQMFLENSWRIVIKCKIRSFKD